jgi:predicted nucleic acid-binding Zn ribbon protein
MSDSLKVLSDRLGTSKANVMTVVFGAWEDLVGEVVATHVKPLRISNGTLVVEADHPAWATQVRQMTPAILRLVDQACNAEGELGSIEVKIGR